jgi:hypothetical protein
MRQRRYKYPDSPGWKDLSVSRDNAIANRVRFNRMQQMVFNLFAEGFVGTSDEAADKLGISPFSCRPRCTELLQQGRLERRVIDRSIPGRSAWVLQLASPPPAPADLEPDLFNDGQPDEQQEWHDYDPNC